MATEGAPDEEGRAVDGGGAGRPPCATSMEEERWRRREGGRSGKEGGAGVRGRAGEGAAAWRWGESEERVLTNRNFQYIYEDGYRVSYGLGPLTEADLYKESTSENRLLTEEDLYKASVSVNRF